MTTRRPADLLGFLLVFQVCVFQDPLPPCVACHKVQISYPVLCLQLLNKQTNLDIVMITWACLSKPTVSSSNPISTAFGPTSLRKSKNARIAASSDIHLTRSNLLTKTVERKRKLDVPSSLVKKKTFLSRMSQRKLQTNLKFGQKLKHDRTFLGSLGTLGNLDYVPLWALLDSIGDYLSNYFKMPQLFKILK